MSFYRAEPIVVFCDWFEGVASLPTISRCILRQKRTPQLSLWARSVAGYSVWKKTRWHWAGGQPNQVSELTMSRARGPDLLNLRVGVLEWADTRIAGGAKKTGFGGRELRGEVVDSRRVVFLLKRRDRWICANGKPSLERPGASGGI